VSRGTDGSNPVPLLGSYATHGAVVAVDPETGFVEILDFAVAEDCGTMVNPMIVEGQIRGGVVQCIGTALYEEIPYDDAGQPLAGGPSLCILLVITPSSPCG
jgi:CO/xanthine dehydrogenase Mo-binding subunit